MVNLRLGDCKELLKDLDDNSVDLIVTSPPYAEQRKDTYGGIKEEDYVEWFKDIAIEIKRVLKDSGSFVLNIKENVDKGVRSTYVLQLVLYLSTILKWKDTYIWNKLNPFPTGSKKRLKDGFEYCYWFTKTDDYKFFPNAVLVKSTSRYLESEKKRKNKFKRKNTNGSGMGMSVRYISDYVRPSNVITFSVDSTNHLHPATFPTNLPEFFIKLMTEENDVVLDIFMGSGTTGYVSVKNKRSFIGFEIIETYYNIAKERIEKIKNEDIKEILWS